MSSGDRIDDYGFGFIVIEGKRFTSDVILHPDRVDASWWRKEGHLLIWEDLPFLDTNPPKILVVGTGRFGMMKIHPDFQRKVRENDIVLIAERTGKAVQVYNQYWKQGERRLVGAFHLTC